MQSLGKILKEIGNENWAVKNARQFGMTPEQMADKLRQINLENETKRTDCK